MKSDIFKSLNNLGLTSIDTRFVFSKGTRDNPNLIVWKDRDSGLIYIDDHYIGDEAYRIAEYRTLEGGGARLEDARDTERRFKYFEQYFVGKRVLDFGCGQGQFLKRVRGAAKEVAGVELDSVSYDSLTADSITMYRRLDSVPNHSFDTVFLFHVFEHLPKPLEFLVEIRQKLVPGGFVVIEVPQANDFLLTSLELSEFKQFTLWSQHLVLHTRESLRRFLMAAGYTKISIVGCQRYSLSNHLHWLSEKKPGGHLSFLSVIDNESLNREYANALASIDATDSLVAICEV